MYELSRVRLRSVGPAGARYQDVTLDFSGAGALVEPPQGALFNDGVYGSARPRRPSPASVLFLENGGGKSVLIKLIFSVMLPGRRQVVGTTSTRVLENFVGAGDTAHVVLEWLHVTEGHRVVTGKVSEWAGKRSSADAANLKDHWYCFRPTEKVGLDSLPLTRDGRFVPASLYRQLLDKAQADEPEIDLFWTDRHGDWTERLDTLGLDTELFRYQRAMNTGEGEAADAFAFGTDEAFVDFLLTAVLAEQEPRDLADNLARYAETLAQRGILMTERDFVSGALDRLGPLAEASGTAETARAAAEDTRAELRDLAAAITARHAVEQDRLDTLSAQVAEVTDAEQEASAEHRRRAAVATELRRLVAALRLAQAEEQQREIEAEYTEARLTAEAWRETGTVLDQRSASNRAKELRDLVGSREEKAAPALRARTEAATALARGLLALAVDAERQAADWDANATASRGYAAQAQQDRDDATTRAAGHRAKTEATAARIAELRAEIGQAVEEGMLAADTDVAEAARRAAVTEENAAAAVHRAEQDADHVAAQLAEARSTALERWQAAATAQAEATRHAETLGAARNRTETLAADPRVAELLVDPGTFSLDDEFTVLTERLDAAIAEARGEQTRLHIAENVDERVLSALGDGGLLPPPDEVGAVIEALEQHGIPTSSGWRYLSTLDSAGQRAMLRRLPHLVSGVLLTNRDQAGRAQEVLRDNRLLPSSLLAVGTVAAVDGVVRGAADGTADGIEFLVEPNPAMYDEDAADAERDAITSRQAQRRGDLAGLGDAVNRDEKLLRDLRQWRADYPPGSIDELTDRAAQSGEAAQEAATVADTAAAAAERLAEREADLDGRLPELRAAHTTAAQSARDLARLAQRVGQIPALTDAATLETENAERAEEIAATAAAEANRLRDRMSEQQRTADDYRRTARSARSDLAEVPGGTEVDPEAPAPGQPVDALRRAYASADQAYKKVEVGSDLRAELEHAEEVDASARAAVDALDQPVRARAAGYLQLPDGSDAATRAEALARANRAVQTASQGRDEAIARVSTLASELRALPSAPSAVPVDQRPRDIDHGHELIDTATAEVTVAARELEELTGRREAAVENRDRAQTSAEGFRLLADAVAHLEPDPDAQAFDGDVEQARTRHGALNTTWQAAGQRADDADRAVREAADQVAQYAADTRFESLTSKPREQMVGVPRSALPEHAQAWTDALRPRLRSLTDELANIDRYRSGIITRLHGMVDNALRTLRAAQRVSRLPENLGDWSGQEFLRIRFTELDGNLLAERLGEVVDEAAIGKTADGRPVKRDGLSLVLRGVRAAAPKGFRVDMLKPDAVLRTERERVSEIRDVFSGGQQLTAAIILYCTLAALRANNRGRVRNPHSGVLFLDNPIGRASAGYLLELQRSVAEALGVQLIYTTGLFDAGALAEFPLIIRLRNDADLRAGRKYLSVDDTIRNRLYPEPGTLDAEAAAMDRITATRQYELPMDADDGAGVGGT